MNGYLRVALAMPKIYVGNINNNLENIKNIISEAYDHNVKIISFPELALTSCNLKDLYKDRNILNDVLKSLVELKHFSNNFDMLINLSVPLEYRNNLYETNVIIKQGNIIAIIINNNLENNYFDKTYNILDSYKLYDYINDMYDDIIITDKFGLEYQNDQNIIMSFSSGKNYDSLDYSNVLFNSNSINETIFIDNEIKKICNIVNENKSCIICTNPSFTESSTDKVYFSKSFVYECDELITINDSIDNRLLISDIDLDKIESMNKKFDLKNVKIENLFFNDNYKYDNKTYRNFNKTPYIINKKNPYKFSMHIIDMAAIALAKRMDSINVDNLVLGFSGGLDSTLALLIILKTIQIKKLTNDSLHIYSMPSYGTSVQTQNNIYNIKNALKLNINEINIKDAMNIHFRDINHDENNTNITFENAQARERTQILMDIANDINGIVVGTCDLSEIVLGFSTYNGDQMSMYNVNAPIPKTLIRYILNSIADENMNNNMNINLANALKGILNTPISPELIPGDNANILQKSEEILGNYELHDFFTYHYLKYHYDINKLYDLAINTFILNNDVINDYTYSEEYIKETLNKFFDRLYKSQFKRNASPDTYDIGLPNISNAYFNAPSDIETCVKI